jgi:repressor LexA
MSLTQTRTRILEFIKGFIDERVYSPTFGEIQKACGISSKSVVEYHLKVLEGEGHIRRDAETTRAIEISGMGKRAWNIPLLGIIAAGQPIPIPTEDTWHNATQETVEVPTEMLPKGAQVYALRVKGKSMIDALVNDGDVIVLEATPVVDDGQMVAAWLTDRQEATLKKIYHEPGRIRLQPANERMKSIYVDPGSIQVQGRVIGILRRYA